MNKIDVEEIKKVVERFYSSKYVYSYDISSKEYYDYINFTITLVNKDPNKNGRTGNSNYPEYHIQTSIDAEKGVLLHNLYKEGRLLESVLTSMQGDDDHNIYAMELLRTAIEKDSGRKDLINSN